MGGNVSIVTSEQFKKHSNPYLFETPQRWEVIQKALDDAGYGDKKLEPRRAEDDDLLLVHTEGYLDKCKKRDKIVQESNILGKTMRVDGDILIDRDTFETARYAAGAVLTGLDEIVKGVTRRVFCNVRPPGHHATRDESMGFCYFNNVAIGAEYARQKLGYERIVIVDFDVHHGNGTQAIFKDDPGVLYISTHRGSTKHDPFYPGQSNKKREAMSVKSSDNGTYNYSIFDDSRSVILQIYEKEIPDLIRKHKPDLLIISAGFDGYKHDPLGGETAKLDGCGGFSLDIDDYETITRHVCDAAPGIPVLSVLEGGYNLDRLGDLAVAHVAGLQ